jgi:hypothetical protein
MKMLGSSKHTPSERKKKAKIETKADRLNDGDPPPPRPPEKYHNAPSTGSSPTKQHLQEGKRPLLPGPDSPRVSPDTHREVDGRQPQCPSWRTDATSGQHHVGVGRADKNFSQKTLSTTPGRSVASEPREDSVLTPPISPPTNMRQYGHEVSIIVSTQLRLRGLQGRAERSLHHRIYLHVTCKL